MNKITSKKARKNSAKKTPNKFDKKIIRHMDAFNLGLIAFLIFLLMLIFINYNLEPATTIIELKFKNAVLKHRSRHQDALIINSIDGRSVLLHSTESQKIATELKCAEYGDKLVIEIEKEEAQPFRIVSMTSKNEPITTKSDWRNGRKKSSVLVSIWIAISIIIVIAIRIYKTRKAFGSKNY